MTQEDTRLRTNVSAPPVCFLCVSSENALIRMIERGEKKNEKIRDEKIIHVRDGDLDVKNRELNCKKKSLFLLTFRCSTKANHGASGEGRGRRWFV